MFKVTEKKNTSVLAQLGALAQGVTLEMAQVGAEELEQNLSAGSRSGVQYPNQPRRSSAPGQYSQEQTGRLKGMVGWGVLSPGVVYFGLEPKTAAEREEALAQEFGAPRNNLVGRANVRRTAIDPRTLAKMRVVKP